MFRQRTPLTSDCPVFAALLVAEHSHNFHTDAEQTRRYAAKKGRMPTPRPSDEEPYLVRISKDSQYLLAQSLVTEYWTQQYQDNVMGLFDSSRSAPIAIVTPVTDVAASGQNHLAVLLALRFRDKFTQQEKSVQFVPLFIEKNSQYTRTESTLLGRLLIQHNMYVPEGYNIAGHDVLIVDDHMNKGAMAMTAYCAAREAGANPHGVACLTSNGEIDNLRQSPVISQLLADLRALKKLSTADFDAQLGKLGLATSCLTDSEAAILLCYFLDSKAAGDKDIFNRLQKALNMGISDANILDSYSALFAKAADSIENFSKEIEGYSSPSQSKRFTRNDIISKNQSTPAQK